MQQLFWGFGSSQKLKQIFRNKNKIFLVVDKSSYVLCGARDMIDEVCTGKLVLIFDDFSSNPKLEDVKRGIDVLYRFQPDLIIAIGGGSTLDMAKLINILGCQQVEPELIILKKQPILKKGYKMAVFPTTAGTGSEATCFAVVYMDRKKYSVDHEFLLPDYAIIDPVFTMSLPQNVTACSGLDALSQGIEAFWSINANRESKRYSRKAICLALKNLKTAYISPNQCNRLAMAKAAYYGGKAINIARTTAPHAFSYFFTTYYNLPHGHAVGLTLGRFFIYNYQFEESVVLDPRGKDYLRSTMRELLDLMEVSDPDEANEKINQLMFELGLTTDWNQIGFKPEQDLPALLENINLERLKNNPVKIQRNDIKKIFEL